MCQHSLSFILGNKKTQSFSSKSWIKASSTVRLWKEDQIKFIKLEMRKYFLLLVFITSFCSTLLSNSLNVWREKWNYRITFRCICFNLFHKPALLKETQKIGLASSESAKEIRSIRTQSILLIITFGQKYTLAKVLERRLQVPV